MSTNNWAVFRLDYSSNEFLVEKGLTEQQARALVAEYESRKHHQHYWAAPLAAAPVDFQEGN